MLDVGYMLDKKYEVLKVLGSGGMGTVYLCKNTRLDSLWAVKEVKNSEKIDLLAEPNILKRLKHPGIPRVIDIFYEDDKLYMVEDYIEGVTLKDYIKNKRIIGIEKIKYLLLEICDIVDYLHSMDPPIIYRDLKPSNIMITPEEKVVLIDFGISKTYKDDKTSDTVAMGSNGYAAPEQCGIGKSCIQTDIYGIGMVMYYILKGKSASTALEPLMDENYESRVDGNLKRIIQKCVQIDIKSRYNSVRELKWEICGLQGENRADDKTVLMGDMGIKPKGKKKNMLLKRSVAGLLLITMGIIAGSYLYGKVKENSDLSNITLPASSNNVESNQIQNETPGAVNETPPANNNDKTAITPNNSTSMNNNIDNEFVPKGRAKGRKKK